MRQVNIAIVGLGQIGNYLIYELKKNHADEIDFSKAGSMIKELLNK